MKPDQAYTAARQAIDPDADYIVHVRTDTGWTRPGDPDQRELPGLDVLLAARRVLRAQPAGSVWCTPGEALNVRTGDGRLWLRFVPSHLAATEMCENSGCAEFLNDAGDCMRCATGPFRGEGSATRLWRVLGRADSAVVPLTRDDLTTADLVTLARACHTLSRQHHADRARTPLPAEAEGLLERLALVVDGLDEGHAHAVDANVAFSRGELLTLAETALALYRAHGDSDDLLGRATVLLLAHLAYADMPD
ncbi:hypothetical protein OG800_50375 (plasmid) [Streptomyces sp. NBC_00445]|uniref:hypothetical protein n=1 Tax=Streptomyces sp. NBC_00445 TaxID=2975745 RepID=UPI002E1E1372